MEFSISRYKNNPNLLIGAKAQKLMVLNENLMKFRKDEEHTCMEEIKTAIHAYRRISDFLERTEDIHERSLKRIRQRNKKIDKLFLSTFRDIVSLDMAKGMSSKTRIEPSVGFRMIRKALTMDKSVILLEKHAIRTQTYVLFALEGEVQKELLKSFVKQVSSGRKNLTIPKKFLI